MSPSRTPLPGLVKLYLASLYVAVLVLMCLGMYLSSFLNTRYYSLYDYLPVFLMYFFAGLGMWNIVAIHSRSHGAPRFSRIFLGFCIALGTVAAIFALTAALNDFSPFDTQSATIWTGLMQNLVVTVAWFLYWKRSPRVGAAFGIPMPERPGQTAPSLELMRLAGVYILVTGLCYSVSFAVYQSNSLDGPTTNPGHWLVLGLLLTAFLLLTSRATQKTFDRLGWLLIFWMAVLICLWLSPFWLPWRFGLLAWRVYFPGMGVPLHVEAVMVIAMFWYVASRSLVPGANPSSALWVRAARAAQDAGVRGLDALCIPLLFFIMGTIAPAHGQPRLMSDVYISIFGCGLLISLFVLIARPRFFITYMRYFTAAATTMYLIRWGDAAFASQGLSLSLLQAIDWNTVTYMLLGMLYFGLRERITAHPALVVMRFTAWGCIALSCVMLIQVPLFFGIAGDQFQPLWYAISVGLPWMYLPFAVGLLYAGRAQSGWNGVPGGWFTASAIGLIAMLHLEALLALFVYTLPRLPWEYALRDALEGYARMQQAEWGVALALALCLWALSMRTAKQHQETY